VRARRTGRRVRVAVVSNLVGAIGEEGSAGVWWCCCCAMLNIYDGWMIDVFAKEQKYWRGVGDL
jgi:hypothetical protein